MHARMNTRTTQRCDGDRVDIDDSGTIGGAVSFKLRPKRVRHSSGRGVKAKSRLSFIGAHHYYLSGFGGKASPTCLKPHHARSNALAFKPPGPIGCVRKSNQPLFSRAIFVFFRGYNMKRGSKSASPST